MATDTIPPAPTAPNQAAGKTEADFRVLAAKAAVPPAKTKPGAPPVVPSKGGRRTAAEEAALFAAKQGLRLVPADQAGQVAGGGAGGLAPGYVPDPAFVSRMAKTLLQGIEAWAKRTIFNRVCRITAKLSGKADEKEARLLSGEVAAPPGTIDVMSESLAEICRKYDLIGQWTPEAVFCVSAGTWGLSVVGVFERLKELESRVDKALATPRSATS